MHDRLRADATKQMAKQPIRSSGASGSGSSGAGRRSNRAQNVRQAAAHHPRPGHGRSADGELNGLKKGALVIGIMDPYGQDAALKALADAGASAFALE